MCSINRLLIIVTIKTTILHKTFDLCYGRKDTMLGLNPRRCLGWGYAARKLSVIFKVWNIIHHLCARSDTIQGCGKGDTRPWWHRAESWEPHAVLGQKENCFQVENAVLSKLKRWGQLGMGQLFPDLSASAWIPYVLLLSSLLAWSVSAGLIKSFSSMCKPHVFYL